MNKEQAKAWLPLIQAVAEGKTLQVLKKIQGSFEQVWCDIEHNEFNSLWTHDFLRLRIKPEPKKAWYRIALFKSGTLITLSDGDDEQAWKSKSNFVRWLTDRIEYELPEGEA